MTSRTESNTGVRRGCNNCGNEITREVQELRIQLWVLTTGGHPPWESKLCGHCLRDEIETVESNS